MSNETPALEQAEIVSFAGELIQKTSKIYLNLGQEFIWTTDDKVRLCLNKYLSRVEKRKAWVTPLGILLTILIVFPTTTFQPFVCSGETWEAAFIISGLISLVWLIRSIWQARVSTSVDDVMVDIKRSAIAADLPASATQGGLSVILAIYGARDKTADVTELVKSKVSGEKLELYVSNDNLGGDPIELVVKTLKVTYSYAGETRTVETTEHDTLSLP